MVSLGQWSFCIYMAHPVVISLTLPLLGTPSLLGAALGCLLVVFAVTGVSYLLYATFERPLERWLRGADDLRASSELSPVDNEVLPSTVRISPQALATD